MPFISYCQTATGIVRDTNALPIAGITVTVKGTGNKTSTSAQGFFKIKLSGHKQLLQFSGAGFKPLEVPADTQRQLLVILHPKVGLLDEVQVIAYGTSTRRYNVGSVTKISADDIEKQPVSNPLAALEGRVPGLVVTATSGLPGSSFNVQIRGQNTLKSNLNQLTPALDNPLFIIDGVPFSPQNGNINRLTSIQSPGISSLFNDASGGFSPFNSLNPSDIESIEVLRDADATAIYGSRGGNGVILITTKKGKAEKTDFNMNLYDGMSFIGKTMPMMNTREYLTMRREALVNGGISPNLTLWDEGYAPDLLVFDTTKYTDWKKYFLGNTAHNTNINASISGGNATTQFRLSAGYNRNTYIFPGDYADNKVNFSSNIHHKSANGKLDIDFTTNYSYDKNNSSGTPDLLSAYTLEPDFPDLTDKNGNLVWSYKEISLGYGASDNPLTYLKNKYYIENVNLIGHLQISYQLFKDLTLRTSLGYNTFYSKEYFGNPAAAQNPVFNSPASASFGTNNYNTWIIEPQVEYRKQIGKSNFDILAGGTLQRNANDQSQMTGYGYTNDDLIGSITAAPTQYASDAYSEYKYIAAFGRINYMYDKKYIIDLNARRDGSSRFGPGKQFGNFSSVGAGWLFSEENFAKEHLKFLSYGKLNGSYGTTGSDAIADYQYLSRWAPTNYSYGDEIGYLPQNLFNPSLSWATTKKLEFGLELGWLQNRILFSTTWYRDRSGNQLVGYKLPAISGFNSITANLNATVQNTGLEFTLQSTNIKIKAFSWTSAINVTIPKNKLIAFPGLATSSYYTTYAIGKSVNTIFGFKYAGVNDTTGLFQFYNAKGQVTYNPSKPSAAQLNDYQNIGNLEPKFYGGFQNTFIYKGFQLDVFVEFKKQIGANYLMQAYSNLPGFELNEPEALLKRWQKPGDKTNIEKFSTQYGDAYTAAYNLLASNGVYSDASYIRLKTLSLSYNLNSKAIRKIGIKSLRLFCNAENLFTISDYLGNDPETQSIYSVPVLKTIVFGFQLTL